MQGGGVMLQSLTEADWQTNEGIARRLNEVIAAVNGREAARRCPECGKAMVRRPDAQGAWCIYRCFGCGHIERDLGICVERAHGVGQ